MSIERARLKQRLMLRLGRNASLSPKQEQLNCYASLCEPPSASDAKDNGDSYRKHQPRDRLV